MKLGAKLNSNAMEIAGVPMPPQTQKGRTVWCALWQF
jgi:hypothetical protein